MKTKIVYSEKCLGYGTWHIEGPQRVKVAHEILQTKGYTFVEPTPATDEDLLTVHDADYLFNVKKGLVEDSDTPATLTSTNLLGSRLAAHLLLAKLMVFRLCVHLDTTSEDAVQLWVFTHADSVT